MTCIIWGQSIFIYPSSSHLLVLSVLSTSYKILLHGTGKYSVELILILSPPIFWSEWWIAYYWLSIMKQQTILLVEVAICYKEPFYLILSLFSNPPTMSRAIQYWHVSGRWILSSLLIYRGFKTGGLVNVSHSEGGLLISSLIWTFLQCFESFGPPACCCGLQRAVMSSFTIYALVSILLTSPPCAISKVLCMSYTELNRATLSVKDTPTQMVSRRAIWGFQQDDFRFTL